MCILSYLPADVELDDAGEESLWNGGISNPDGHGWAIAAGDRLVLGKSLDLHEAIEDFADARARYPEFPALFHSRWATHGSVRVGNCHPFLVGGSHQTVLAHNGVLPQQAWPLQGDDRSDTAILAEVLLPQRWFRLDRPTVRQSLTEWCGPGNKLVILTVNPRYQRNAYLINEGKGDWDPATGIWHSNFDYIWPSKWGSYTTTPQPAETATAKELLELEDPTQCYFCGQGVNQYGLCTTCGTCQDCYEDVDSCQCAVTSMGTYKSGWN